VHRPSAASAAAFDEVRSFVKQVLGMSSKDETKVLRVYGHDPMTGGIEPVDLLKQKLVRHVDMERSRARSKVLNTNSAYRQPAHRHLRAGRHHRPA
jgi:hypothetical protein